MWSKHLLKLKMYMFIVQEQIRFWRWWVNDKYYQQYIDIVTKKGPEEMAKATVKGKLIEAQYNGCRLHDKNESNWIV
jgi:hypothetical protein